MKYWLIMEAEYSFRPDGQCITVSKVPLSLHRTETGKNAKLSDLNRNKPKLERDTEILYYALDMEVVE